MLQCITGVPSAFRLKMAPHSFHIKIYSQLSIVDTRIIHHFVAEESLNVIRYVLQCKTNLATSHVLIKGKICTFSIFSPRRNKISHTLLYYE